MDLQTLLALNVEAYPVPSTYSQEIKRANRMLRDRYGTNQFGDAHFRVVDGREATCIIGGRTSMTYPYRCSVVTAWRVEELDEAGNPVYETDAEGNATLDAEGNRIRNWIDLLPDPRDWAPQYERYKGVPGAFVKYRAMAGVPYCFMEGWVPPSIACEDWDERIFGPRPTRGDYAAMWPIKDDRERPRAPTERDVEEVGRFVAAYEMDPVLKRHRWEAGRNPEQYEQRVNRDYEAYDEAEARERVDFVSDKERLKEIEARLVAAGVLDSRIIYPRVERGNGKRRGRLVAAR
jgi:hypothetical protein